MCSEGQEFGCLGITDLHLDILSFYKIWKTHPLGKQCSFEACKIKGLHYRRVQNSCLSTSIHTCFVKLAASFWALRQK
jgi:hypothetical protein